MRKVSRLCLILFMFFLLSPKVVFATEYEDFDEMSRTVDLEDAFEKVVINIDEKTVLQDGEVSSLTEVFDISKTQEKRLMNSEYALDKYLETTNYEVSNENSEIIIKNPYQTKRLIFVGDNLADNFNAIKIAQDGSFYLLEYETEDATKEAYEKLLEIYGEDAIFLDEVIVLNATTPSTLSTSSTDLVAESGVLNLKEKINNYTGTKNNVKLAIIDSGVNPNVSPISKVLNTSLSKGFIGESDYSDSVGHGTMVSFVASRAIPDNVELIMYRTFDSNGKTTSAAICNALNQSIIDNVDIVNLSFGSTSQLKLILQKIEEVYNNNIIIVTAAGNEAEDGISADQISPGNSPYTINVSAISNTKENGKYKIADFSCIGDCIDFSALGDNLSLIDNTGNYQSISGTSFAAPLVASEFAILKTFCGDKSVEEYKEIMKKFISTDFNEDIALNSNYKSQEYGYGYCNFSDIELCTKNEANCKVLYHDNAILNFNLGEAEGAIPSPLEGPIISSLPTMNINGYEFIGWFDEANNEITTPYKILKDETAYAHWKKNEYNITLKDGDKIISSSTLAFKATFNTKDLQKDGFTFNGWYNGNTRVILPLTVTSDLTLTAGWKVKEYKVILMDSDNVVLSEDVKENNSISLPSLTKEGYTFKGWKDSNGNYYNSVYTIKADTVLYADWTINQYTVNFVSDGTIVSSNIYNFNTVINPISIIKEGYHLDGWYSNNTQVNFPLTVRNNLTLDANWIINQYTINFISNGKVVDTQVVNYSGSFVLPTVQREGYEFIGWFDVNDNLVDYSYQIKENTTFVAKWDADDYYIRLVDGNEIISEEYFDYETTINLPELTKEGYTFNGWYAQNGSKSNNTITVTNNLTLYANWTKVLNTYTISFDDLYGEKIDPLTVSEGDFITELPVLTKEGYEFGGWHTSEGEEIVLPYTVTKSETFYSYWGIHEYTITISDSLHLDLRTEVVPYGTVVNLETLKDNFEYKFLGWYVDNQKVSSVTITKDTFVFAEWEKKIYTLTLKDGTSSLTTLTGDYNSTVQLPELTKEGYTFNGWYNSSGTKVNNTYTISKNETLNAKWTKVEENYTVYFNSNNSKVKNPDTLTTKGTIKLPTLSCEGYDFLGWETPEKTIVNSSYNVTKNVTLIAKWQIKTYTLKLTNGNNTEITQVSHGQTYTLPTLTKEGYTFDGWYNGNAKVTSVIVTSNLNLVAKWSPRIYTIKFYDGSKVINTISIKHGETFSLPTLTKEGYTFIGWYTSDNKKFSQNTVTANVNLYAKFEIKKFKVTFINEGKTVKTQEVSYGNSATAPIITKTGYTYNWDKEYKKITGNLIVTAIWTANTYIIEYNANGGSGTMKPQYAKYDTNFSLNKNTFKATNKTFIGWALTPKGNVVYTDNKKVKNLRTNGTIVLYAKWKDNPPQVKISFFPNYGSNKQSVKMIDKDTKISSLPTLTRKNYIFEGWYTKKTKGTKITSSTKFSKTTNLYAHWQKVPEKTSTPILKKSKKNLVVSINKVSGVKGYQYQYSTSSKFNKVTNVVSGKTEVTIKNLKAKTTYYVRVRSYKVVNGLTYFSSYSKVKKIKM